MIWEEEDPHTVDPAVQETTDGFNKLPVNGWLDGS